MKYLLLIPSLLFWIVAFSQSPSSGSAMGNIVPNPGFELFSSMPIGWFYKGDHFSQVMKYWDSPTAASPDVFGPNVRVPKNWADKGFGRERAHGGESMVGLTCYGCKDGKPHCREYVQIHLSEPLVVGQNYYVEFWVTHLENSLQINNLGVCFVEEKVQEIIDGVLNLTPQAKVYGIVSAPNGRWRRLSAVFQADAPANYLLVGNFSPDSLTQVRRPESASLNYAYYYIDDILVHKVEPILEVPVPEDDLSRIPLEEGQIIRLKNIFFETDKYELLPRSYIELNKLLDIMRRNPEMVIEIRGHTDSRGEDRYNQYLSRKRAEAVVEFLLANGISAERTRYKGFGDTLPVATNETAAGMQLNRRVEFLIIKK